MIGCRCCCPRPTGCGPWTCWGGSWTWAPGRCTSPSVSASSPTCSSCSRAQVSCDWSPARSRDLTRASHWSARELRPLLVFIWAKILAVDPSCQHDLVRDSAANRLIVGSCTITEKAPTRAFSWLKAPTSAFTFKTLLRPLMFPIYHLSFCGNLLASPALDVHPYYLWS